MKNIKSVLNKGIKAFWRDFKPNSNQLQNYVVLISLLENKTGMNINKLVGIGKNLGFVL